MTTPGLALRRVDVDRGSAHVVRGVDLEVAPGSVSVLLGANGAGKTTLLESISGILPVAGGTIELDGDDVTRRRRHERARGGIAHVEQGRTIFGELTVHENLIVAGPRTAAERAYDTFPALAEMRHRPAGLLSGGEQQMLVIARALIRDPRVIMLDEMSLGLAPIIVHRLIETIAALAAEGLAVLLVEQFAALALGIGDRAYVMAGGEMAYSGSCGPLLDDPGRLHDLYLGSHTAVAAADERWRCPSDATAGLDLGI